MSEGVQEGLSLEMLRGMWVLSTGGQRRTPGLYLRSTFAHQGQLRISTGIHSKFKVTGTKTQHGTTFTSQNWRTDEGIGQAGPRRHCHQMRTGSIFAIQCVYKGCQLFCVHLLGEGRTEAALLPALLPHPLPLQHLSGAALSQCRHCYGEGLLCL